MMRLGGYDSSEMQYSLFAYVATNRSPVVRGRRGGLASGGVWDQWMRCSCSIHSFHQTWFSPHAHKSNSPSSPPPLRPPLRPRDPMFEPRRPRRITFRGGERGSGAEQKDDLKCSLMYCSIKPYELCTCIYCIIDSRRCVNTLMPRYCLPSQPQGRSACPPRPTSPAIDPDSYSTRQLKLYV